MFSRQKYTVPCGRVTINSIFFYSSSWPIRRRTTHIIALTRVALRTLSEISLTCASCSASTCTIVGSCAPHSCKSWCEAVSASSFRFIAANATVRSKDGKWLTGYYLRQFELRHQMLSRGRFWEGTSKTRKYIIFCIKACQALVVFRKKYDTCRRSS